jgi:hypothetical protein
MSPDGSFVVGPTELARMFGKHRDWARRRLREWLREQELGGPKRVFTKTIARGRLALYTTVAIVEREFPNARRDPVLERRLRTFDEDLDRAFRRIADLERRVGMRR